MGNKKDEQLETFIRTLPKTELHYHFEGAIPWSTILKLHPDRKALPTFPPWYYAAHFDDFNGFLDVFKDYVRPCLLEIDSYLQAAEDIIRSLREDGVEYAEWNVSLRVLHDNGISIKDCFGQLGQLVRDSARGDGPVIKFIAGINREFDLAEKLSFLNEIDGLDEISGVDLHGWEDRDDLKNNLPFFNLAKEHNWKVKVHAGELAGPENVRYAVEQLGIRHIAHGIRAADDDDLLGFLSDNAIVLELCPSSNLFLKVFESIESYPIQKLMNKGVKVTLNTDDPMIFNCTLLEQYRLSSQAGLSPLDLATCSLNGFEASLLPVFRKQMYQKRCLDLVNTYVSSGSNPL
ncbi:adenosine deaminase family protein [bacterium]|nr:adenosine deaminase family protein [bacterium]